MEGVRILASEEVATAWETWNWEAFWAAIGISVVVALIAGVIFGIQESDFSAFLCMSLTMLIAGSAILGLLAGFGINGEVTEYETHYKVIIDEDVSLKDFYEQYEVIDQEGEIFIVRERVKTDD
jgi:hypothetical protein